MNLRRVRTISRYGLTRRRGIGLLFFIANDPEIGFLPISRLPRFFGRPSPQCASRDRHMIRPIDGL
jgi:hypothetical protein